MMLKKMIGLCLIAAIVLITLMAQAEEEILGYDNLYLGERELHRGEEGADIALLQRELKKDGYYQGAIDGLFGPATREAVVQFQEEMDLDVTGYVDRKMLSYFDGDQLISKMNISRSDLLALARVIHGEARGENFRGMVAVGAVILNRVEDERFPDNIQEVIGDEGQFSSLMDGQANLYPDENSMNAARAALLGYDPSRDSLFFYNPEVATNLAWISNRPIVKRIGAHVFAR